MQEEIKRYSVEFYFDGEDEWNGADLFIQLDADEADRLMERISEANTERFFRLSVGGNLVNLKKVKYIKIEPIFEEEDDVNS